MYKSIFFFLLKYLILRYLRKPRSSKKLYASIYKYIFMDLSGKIKNNI